MITKTTTKSCNINEVTLKTQISPGTISSKLAVFQLRNIDFRQFHNFITHASVYLGPNNIKKHSLNLNL